MVIWCHILLLSHPGKLLVDHLRNVGIMAEQFIREKSLDFRDVLGEVAYIIGVCHDFGKATTFFQRLINNGDRKVGARHSMISGVFTFYVLDELIRDGAISIPDDSIKLFLPLLGFLVVSEHHGELKDLIDYDSSVLSRLSSRISMNILHQQVNDLLSNNFDEIARIYDDLLGKRYGVRGDEFIKRFLINFDEIILNLKRVVIRLSSKMNILAYFLTILLYSVLIDADRFDAIGVMPAERIIDIPGDIVDKYKSIRFSESSDRLGLIRDAAYLDVISKINRINVEKDRIFSITLPTGSGKTLISFSFAIKLRELIKNRLGFVPRIIYSLPFLSIIEQNFDVIRDVLGIYLKDNAKLSNLLLKHHHLVELSYIMSGGNCDEEFSYVPNICKLDPVKSSVLIESWQSEIIVTTFIQLFHSILTNKKNMSRKFHNIINSIIILDEVQSIPHKYWLLLNRVLRYLASKFNCWIILVTATQPLIFRENYFELVSDIDKYFSVFNRVKFNYDGSMSIDDFKSRLLEDIINSKDDILVILNTIRSVNDVYTFLNRELTDYYGVEPELNNYGVSQFKNFDLIALSTHIIPKHRQMRIKYIKNNNKRNIVITTQLVEAGVDISFRKVYRDLAPLDSIIQSAGRCNRNFEWEFGDFRIVTLRDERGVEYWKYIYDPILVSSTMSILSNILNKTMEEKDFVKVINRYFEEIDKRSSKDESRNILNAVENLRFSSIREFKLIEERYINASIFIEIDDKASNLLDRFNELLIRDDLGRYEKRDYIRNIKRRMQEYIINVLLSSKARKLIDNLNFVDKTSLLLIPKEDLARYYRVDTGLILEGGEEAFIL